MIFIDITHLLDFVLQVSDIVQENALLKGKLVTLNEMLTNTELESKASRETIMRLVSEVGREQKVASRYNTDYDTLRMVCLPCLHEAVVSK